MAEVRGGGLAANRWHADIKSCAIAAFREGLINAMGRMSLINL
jgi:hypothetical protein